MPLVRSFLDAHPEVRIDLNLNDGYIDLVEQGMDIAVRVGDLPDSGLIARRVATSQRALVASREYLRALPRGVKAPREPADLALHNCIVYTELATGNEWNFRAGGGPRGRGGARQQVRAQGNLRTNSSEVVRAAVLDGMGISFSPVWLFSAEIASGEVQVLLPEWTVAPMSINLVSPPQRRNAAKVVAFAEHVAAALAQPGN